MTVTASRSFRSVSAGGLDFDSPPMRLWEKAKRMGIWNPQDVDFSTDRQHWLALDDGQQDLLLRLASLFEAGEESVTLDLLPLIQVVAAEGRLEEEMYLTSFLWEEAKHVEAFRRFFDKVAQEKRDLSHFHGTSYRRIFCQELPEALGALRHDASPAAQARASVTYNMIVEGVLAETGYHVYHAVLRDNGILPGMQEVVAHLKADESRHLAYGVFLLSRLVAEHGDEVWQTIEERMNELLEPAIGVIQEVFDAYDPAHVPFGLELDPFIEFAMGQFQKRMDRIERSRSQSLEEVLRIAAAD
ncbi:MAG: R2-like ligand-binding oxidase [Acidobacteria bacterium]|nr:R2-like ligand-binding oxidase [Acidobacteriota bacterium]